MRRARFTYQGAFHHVTNRGINGENIFEGSKAKSLFLDLLEEKSRKLKIRLFAYCIMDNHYHLILENSSDMLSEFQKQLNGKYGMVYRKYWGGKGYVFQGRFKSALIENESYLIMAIKYVLLNPLRAGITDEPGSYTWSSYKDYYNPLNIASIVDSRFVEDLFGTKEEFKQALSSHPIKELPILKTRQGNILGTREFLEEAAKRSDRMRQRKYETNQRIDDNFFDPVEKVIWEFEHMNDVAIECIDVTTYRGKRLRGELLVYLKEKAGLTYAEINKFDAFSDLKYSSLGAIYRNARKRML